jgi:hypothetical protein
VKTKIAAQRSDKVLEKLVKSVRVVLDRHGLPIDHANKGMRKRTTFFDELGIDESLITDPFQKMKAEMFFSGSDSLALQLDDRFSDINLDLCYQMELFYF